MADKITVKNNLINVVSSSTETITTDLTIEQIISERDSWERSIENHTNQLNHAQERFDYFNELYLTARNQGVKTQDEIVEENRIAVEEILKQQNSEE